MSFAKFTKKFFPQKYKNIYHLLQAVTAVLWYRYPAGKLTVIGVTGTDGKTTTTTLIYHVLKSAGKRVALVSTVAAYIGNKEIDTGFHVTNPDPWALQKLLRRISDLNYNFVALEVTSHGLDQHRAFGTNIAIGVLTNITHEHLDYHKTYQNYLIAKAKMFNNAKVAILNRSDRSFSEVKKYIDKKTVIIPYDMSSAPAKIVKAIFARFPEDYNRMNALAAYHALKQVGISDPEFSKAIRTFPGVTGRMEEIKNSKGIRIIVDFAHTPNALESVLTSLKGKTKGRLISVFGCASERDEQKRPMMGKISTRIADISIFTAEDTRYEDPEKIISEIIIGAKSNRHPKRFYDIPERGEAIFTAINKLAKPKDIVVICGKGHEKSMNYNGIEYPWSDKDAVLMALRGKIKTIKR